MANFRNVHYEDFWGDKHTVEIDEKDIMSYMAEGNDVLNSLLLAADYVLRDDYAFLLMENGDFTARYLADAKKAVMTTGNFGEDFEGIRDSEEILANQDVYITMLNNVGKALTGKDPFLVSFGDDEKRKKEHIFNKCQQILFFFPCWNIIGMDTNLHTCPICGVEYHNDMMFELANGNHVCVGCGSMVAHPKGRALVNSGIQDDADITIVLETDKEHHITMLNLSAQSLTCQIHIL